MSSFSNPEQLFDETNVNFCDIENPTFSTVRYIQAFNANCKIIVVEQTPFHPVDYNWPDHPSDTGQIVVNEKKYDVVNCLVLGFNHDTKAILLDTEITVKKNTPGWTFHVAHIVEDNDNYLENEITENQKIALKINKISRKNYSVSHSICHLTALALNATCKDYWKKSIDRIDTLGNPDLDALAIQSSKIKEHGSIDIYRLGKSIRKKGLQVSEVVEDLDVISNSMEKQVTQWISQKPVISLKPLISCLNARREWSCELDGKRVVIPCGGTHPQELSSSTLIEVKAEFSEQQLHIETFLTHNLS